jgi:RNA polymerase sigma-70 factor (ECF subfamily)
VPPVPPDTPNPPPNQTGPSPSNQQMGGDDAAIVEQVQAGDTDAFRYLVERHSQGIFRLAFRMTGNEHDAEDVVQETFLRAYRQLHRFESRSAFGTWLHRIGANCAVDVIRVRRQRDEVTTTADENEGSIVDTLPTAVSAPDHKVFKVEVRQKVITAMASLSTMERAAFVLRHFEDMPIREIGATLGLKENATKNTIFRALGKIRRELEPIMSELR